MIRPTFLALSVLIGTTHAQRISFEKEVLPILTRYCVMCHLPDAAQGGLVLYPDAWSRLVGVPSVQSPLLLVDPGFPDKSYLYIKLVETGESVGGSGLLMPVQQPPLEADQIEKVRLWIGQGAKRN